MYKTTDVLTRRLLKVKQRQLNLPSSVRNGAALGAKRRGEALDRSRNEEEERKRPPTEAASRTPSSSGLPPTMAPAPISPAPAITTIVGPTTIVAPAGHAPTTVRTAASDKSRRAIGSWSSTVCLLNR